MYILMYTNLKQRDTLLLFARRVGYRLVSILGQQTLEMKTGG